MTIQQLKYIAALDEEHFYMGCQSLHTYNSPDLAASGLFKPLKEPLPVRKISSVVSDSFSKKLVLQKMNKAI